MSLVLDPTWKIPDYLFISGILTLQPLTLFMNKFTFIYSSVRYFFHGSFSNLADLGWVGCFVSE